ncbi:DUF2490 domain-containing protein [Hyunsoonleella flava]|uniref:DUF2490 domain-containing protein n=1 Tax=Hyunsoonleella flava TaxID=2527939 RepID=A0A4Q9FEC2_9FLAO|nr:DUF2490 domain-containing protein [Hyunsoonleella flava]TBN03344.1 DUF2490 domain-containing protein [Hyunsoonleella flava]
MRCIKSLILTLCLFACPFLYAQGSMQSLGETAVSVNHKVSKNYSINFAARSRCFLYKDNVVQYQQQQVDIFHFSTFSLNYNHKLSFGVYYRHRHWFGSGDNETRFTQQFNYTKQKLGVRYGHRFRTEQRFLNTKNIFRQRYRFAVDFPLNGEKLDIGEAYLVNAVEGLLSFSKTEPPETDIRVSSQIGWQVYEKLKLQIGLEHRAEAFNLATKHYLFVLTTAVLRI